MLQHTRHHYNNKTLSAVPPSAIGYLEKYNTWTNISLSTVLPTLWTCKKVYTVSVGLRYGYYYVYCWVAVFEVESHRRCFCLYECGKEGTQTVNLQPLLPRKEKKRRDEVSDIWFLFLYWGTWFLEGFARKLFATVFHEVSMQRGYRRWIAHIFRRFLGIISSAVKCLVHS